MAVVVESPPSLWRPRINCPYIVAGADENSSARLVANWPLILGSDPEEIAEGRTN